MLVSVTLGYTLPVTDFGNVKPSITISNIDPSQDVPSQVRAGIEVGNQAFLEIDKHLDLVLSQILSPSLGKPGFKDRLDDLEKYAETVKRNFKNLQAKLKAQDAQIAEALGQTLAQNGRGTGGQASHD